MLVIENCHFYTPVSYSIAHHLRVKRHLGYIPSNFIHAKFQYKN